MPFPPSRLLPSCYSLMAAAIIVFRAMPPLCSQSRAAPNAGSCSRRRDTSGRGGRAEAALSLSLSPKGPGARSRMDLRRGLDGPAVRPGPQRAVSLNGPAVRPGTQRAAPLDGPVVRPGPQRAVSLAGPAVRPQPRRAAPLDGPAVRPGDTTRCVPGRTGGPARATTRLEPQPKWPRR